MQKIAVLGAGIAGISAGYHSLAKGEVAVYEQSSTWGGMCGGFYLDSKIGKFWFDNAVHLSFASDKYVQSTFWSSSQPIRHTPNPINYYENNILKHPAQNNLFGLPVDLKVKAIKDMLENPNKNSNIANYEDWLKAQYGDFFTEHFVKKYTRKYWTTEANTLSTSWVDKRFYIPNVEEILFGAMSEHTPNTYYAKEMNYPKEGQYRNFFRALKEKLNIFYNKKVVALKDGIISFSDKTSSSYDRLISTLPLPKIIPMLSNVPLHVSKAAQNLYATSVAIVSLGLTRANMQNLWFYIYDEDKLFARVYSPSLKSPANAPRNGFSLQAEIYFSPLRSLNKLVESKIVESKDSTIPPPICRNYY